MTIPAFPKWVKGLAIATGSALFAAGWTGSVPVRNVFAQAPSGLTWLSNLEQARQTAATQGRPILVHFWNDNCPPCAGIERNVFSRPDVQKALATGFVAVKIKVDDAPDVAR